MQRHFAPALRRMAVLSAGLLAILAVASGPVAMAAPAAESPADKALATVPAWQFESNNASAAAGAAAVTLGDVNGDGFSDFAVGAPNFDGPGQNQTNGGAVFVFIGGATGPALAPPELLLGPRQLRRDRGAGRRRQRRRLPRPARRAPPRETAGPSSTSARRAGCRPPPSGVPPHRRLRPRRSSARASRPPATSTTTATTTSSSAPGERRRRRGLPVPRQRRRRRRRARTGTPAAAPAAPSARGRRRGRRQRRRLRRRHRRHARAVSGTTRRAQLYGDAVRLPRRPRASDGPDHADLQAPRSAPPSAPPWRAPATRTATATRTSSSARRL